VHVERPRNGPLVVLRDQERLIKIPLAWTSMAPLDVYVLLSAGRSLFRPSDLLALVDLVRVLASREV
jgi:hypothetical protein